MNETIGPLNPEVMGTIGKQLTSNIMVKCKDIVEDIEKQTIKLLTTHKRSVESIAKDLLLNETIDYEKIKSLRNSKLIYSSYIELIFILHKCDLVFICHYMYKH
jgi:ATP-dependent Zn protease